MAFHSLHDFLYMGGFAAFVWPAYLICAICLGAYTWNSEKEYLNIINRLKRKHESNS